MKPSRIRDRPCDFPGCGTLVLRVSKYCRHHLGVLHGAASARTYRCSAACQAVHRRCARCRCLCGGSHQRHLRDQLCFLAGAPSCWSAAHPGEDQLLELFTATCLLCGRTTEWLGGIPAAASCACGSRFLHAEHRQIAAGLRALPPSPSRPFVQDVSNERVKSRAGAGR